MPNEHEISMLRAARDTGITSREEMANFMAQMAHESTGFTRLEEGFRYTRGIHQIPVQSAWREGRQALEAARQEALQGRPQELGRLMYGGRMGNDDAGDGYLYRGRGYTQLTGENNYRAAGTALNIDLINNPTLAVDRGNAEQIAIWFWQSQVPEQDRDDVSRATRAINNGENGLEDRLNRYDAWHAVLTPEFVADFDAGRVRAGAGVTPAAGRPVMEDGALRRLETGEEVRQLNTDLRTLDIRADHNRHVPADDTFTRETEQAVRRFQEQQAMPITGRVDPATLESIEHELQQHRDQQLLNAQPPHDGMQPQVNQSRPDDRGTDHSNDAQAFSTGDPDLDRLAAALFANDDAAISRASAHVGQSPHVQEFEQWGRELVAAQQREELQQQEMARQMQDPVMSFDNHPA